MAQEFPLFGRSTEPDFVLKAKALQADSQCECSSNDRIQNGEFASRCGFPQTRHSIHRLAPSENRMISLIRTLILATLTAVTLVAQTSDSRADNRLVSDQTIEPSSTETDGSAGTTKVPVRTWLDPLRQQRSRKAAPASSTGSSRAVDADNDFDLSEYSQAPDSKPSHLRVPGWNAVRTTGHSQDGTELNEPAEPLSGVEEIVIPESATEQNFFPQTMPETVFSEYPQTREQQLCWQLLPNGLLYKTYLAGEKEARMQLVSYYDTKSKRKIWEAVLGGRAGLIRLSDPSITNSDAFQLDLEGAVFARVLPDEPSAMLEGSDYRVGLYGTWKFDRLSYRAGYYHISAHVGDEFLIANPLFNRINYVRDSALAGASYDLTDVSRVYGEIGYALGVEGGAKPLEFQFGGEYAPLPTTQFAGAPFAAVNTHLREDFNFNGGVNVVAGWGWQGEHSKRRLRLGLNYYNGPSLQYEFFDRWENLVGGGIWLDY